MLPVGTQAPDFTLPDKDGNPVSLRDFRGKKVVLYFYPRDNTPGCTRQACAFAKADQDFASRNAVVIGVSKDSAASHQKFAAKYGLPFVLLSDTETAVLQLYDVVEGEKAVRQGQHGRGALHLPDRRKRRHRAALPKVKPDDNAAQMLALL